MDKQLAFATLGIEKTKDEKIIRSAYHEKLRFTNPEDHPEEFKALREAYETALASINETDEQQAEKEDDSPSGQWMKRVKDIYGSLSARLNIESWKMLLKDDICLDLDYGEEAKVKLFRYLADHYHLKADIWRLLDEYYYIVKEQDKFREFLPVAFVDYILGRIADVEGTQDFPYEWLEGADDADYDNFQNKLYELEDYIAQKKTGQAEPIVTVLRQSGINHPYFELAYSQFCQQTGESDKAVELARKLMPEYRQNLKIQVLASEVLYKCGKIDEAEEGFDYITEEFGKVYLAEKYHAFIDKQKNRIVSAIEHCRTALNYANEPELQDFLRELDEIYLSQINDKLEKGTLPDDEVSCATSSLVRSGNAQRGIDFFNKYPEYKSRIDRGRILTMLYYHGMKFNDCIKEAFAWRKELEKKMEEQAGTEDEAKVHQIKLDLAIANSYIGNSYMAIARDRVLKNPNAALQKYRAEGVNETEHSNTSYIDEFDRTTQPASEREKKQKIDNNEIFDKAMDAFEQALKYSPDDPNMHQQILEIYIWKDEYKAVLDKADEIIAMEPGWFPAYTRKQLACYELGMHQEVINLFYKAKEIFPLYEQIYRYAFKVFFMYKQYQEAENIVKQALEANIGDGMAQVLGLNIERAKANQLSGGERAKALFEVYEKAIMLLKEYLPDENKSRQAIAELYYVLAMLETQQPYDIYRHKGKDLEYARKALALNEYSHEYEYLTASILHNRREYLAAIRMYEKYLSHYPYDDASLINAGVCYEALKEWKKAVKCYEKLLEYNPKHPDINAYIARVYRQRYDDTDILEYGNLALKYWGQQVENTPNDFQPYLDRGIQYNKLNLFREALADAEKVLELDKKNPYGFNLKAKALMYMCKYEQAIYHFKKALEYMDKPAKNGAFLYEYMAFCYIKSNDLANAEYWYRKEIDDLAAIDKEAKPYNAYDFLRLLYYNMREYDKGKALIKEAYERKVYTVQKYREKMLFMSEIQYIENGKTDLVLEDAKEIAEKFKSISNVNEYASILLYVTDDAKAAISVLDKEIKGIQKETYDDWESLISTMMMYYYGGDTSKIEKLSKIIEASIIKDYEAENLTDGIEKYISSAGYGKNNLCNIVQYFICSGQLDKAGEYVERFEKLPFCRDCKNFTGCQEVYIANAMYHEAKGDTDKALELYKKAYDIKKEIDVPIYKLIKAGLLKFDLGKKSDKKRGFFKSLIEKIKD